MIALTIAGKNIKEFFRNFKESMIVIAMPIMFIAVFGFIFKGSNEVKFSVALIVSEDKVYTAMVDELKKIETTTKEKVFVFKEFKPEEMDLAKESVMQKTNMFVLAPNATDTGIIIIGDDRNPYYAAGSGIVSKLAAQIYSIDLSYLTYQAIDVDMKYERNGFDRLVPGLMVYGLLILIPYNAAIFAQITEKKEILRYFFSKVTSKDIILGYLLSQTAFALFQTFLMFWVAQYFGFRTDANLLEVLIIAIPANIFIIALSLLIGSFVKLSQSASNIGSIVSVLLGFLSGSFIVGIESIMQIGEWGGRMISVNQIFPSTLATQAWTQIMLYGKHLDYVVFELVGIVVISIILLIAGIILYQQKQLKRVDMV